MAHNPIFSVFCLTVRIPAEILQEILCNWCSVVEVAFLDSAECNKKDRIGLMSAMAKTMFVFDGEHSETCSMINWCKVRSLKLKIFVFKKST